MDKKYYSAQAVKDWLICILALFSLAIGLVALNYQHELRIQKAEIEAQYQACSTIANN